MDIYSHQASSEITPPSKATRDPVFVDPAPVLALLQHCPAYQETPLHNAKDLSDALGLGSLYIKDERSRMGLGAFKALGAAYVIAADAVAGHSGEMSDFNPSVALSGRTYVTASAGNHGLSVAAGAHVFGARAVIYLAKTVPGAFQDLLRSKGAEVVVEGETYEASMAAAEKAAKDHGWVLLSDTTSETIGSGHRVMEGYLAMGAEIETQIPNPPSHIFLQAGVGGLAAAICAHARLIWGASPRIIVVEPAEAPCLTESVKAEHVLCVEGAVSSMGRLDCKEPSLRAYAALKSWANDFVTVTDAEVESQLPRLASLGFGTSPSGGAGIVAAMLAAQERVLGLDQEASVLAIISEGVVDE